MSTCDKYFSIDTCKFVMHDVLATFGSDKASCLSKSADLTALDGLCIIINNQANLESLITVYYKLKYLD